MESGQQAVIPVFEPLVRMNGAERGLPNLVESWKYSPDGKALTLRLRKGIQYTDGSELNAEDVKYNISHYTFKGLRPADFAAIQSYDVIDNYTLRLTGKEPMLGLLPQLAGTAGMMTSSVAMQKQVTLENMKDHMIGTGPFVLSSWQRGISIGYTKNPKYWQKGKPYLDGIEMVMIPDATTRIMAFQKEDSAIITKITPSDAKLLKTGGYTVLPGAIPSLTFICPDGDNKDSPFANKLVRQALDYAIDKKAMADAIGLGYYLVAHQIMPAGSPAHIPGLQPREYNPARAKELLKRAGYPKGFSTTLTAQNNFDKDALVAVQTYLQAVGIKAEINILDKGIFQTTRGKGWKGLMLVSEVTLHTNSVVKQLYFQLKSQYMSPSASANVRSFIEAPNPKSAEAKLRELTKFSFDEATLLPLWTAPELNAMSKRVHAETFGQGMNWYYWEPASVWLSK